MNSRYFYESFSSREDLLYHVYLDIVSGIAIRAAADALAEEQTIEGQARSALRAGWVGPHRGPAQGADRRPGGRRRE